MTERLSFKSAGAQSPAIIRRHLRFLFEDDVTWPEAMMIAGIANHRFRNQYSAEWAAWIREANEKKRVA